MKWVSRFASSAGILPAMAVVTVLTACGGGSVDTAMVAKALDAAPATVAADGTPIMSMFPAPGSSQLAVDTLAAAGVQSLGKKCGQAVSRVALNGDPMLSAGGTPSYVVLVEVASSDVEKAKAAGFVVASDDYLKTVDVFDCATKSL